MELNEETKASGQTVMAKKGESTMNSEAGSPDNTEGNDMEFVTQSLPME